MGQASDPIGKQLVSFEPSRCYCARGLILPALLSGFVLGTNLFHPFRDAVLSTVHHLWRKGAISSSSYPLTTLLAQSGNSERVLLMTEWVCTNYPPRGWGNNQNVAQWPP